MILKLGYERSRSDYGKSLHPLNFKQATNRAGALFSYCNLNRSSQEFLIQKAIGWALRQDATTQENTLQTDVRAHHQTLPNLSKREALKHWSVDWRQL